MIVLFTALFVSINFLTNQRDSKNHKFTIPSEELSKEEPTEAERRLYVEERYQHEFDLQKNPTTGEIPEEERAKELENSLIALENASQRTTTSSYVSRGPTNLGGRTRALAYDISDATSQTILAGGISSGLYRTTNGGANWTKVSSNLDIHNVSSLAQDPRPGFQNIWYYGTGEWTGNSASLGSAYRGRGIWQSTDGGLSWTQIPGTDTPQETFDPPYDYIHNLVVNPVNGDLMIAATGKVIRYDGTNLNVEVEEPSNGTGWTDVAITSTGRVYATIEGSSSANGVYTSADGNGSWTRIAQNGAPTDWSSTGRIVLATAPSDSDIVYVLYNNGSSFPNIEADLWRYDFGTDTWTDFSAKLPDEAGGNLAGNDPFAIQGAYDLVVNVKPDDVDFVVIGGTNAYKIDDIVNDATFTRIGGYLSNNTYALYNLGGVTHHPDVHKLVFDPTNSNIMLSGTDGGVHRTTDINASTVVWENLNNNYQTYQYYHVALDPDGSNIVFGGAQDNGTTIGGTDAGLPDDTTMSTYFGGDGVAVGIAQRNSGANIQLYYGTQNGNARTNFPGFRSIRPSGSVSQFVTYFYLDPANTNALYYAGGTTLYRTNDAINVTTTVDNAGNWSNLGALPVSQNLRTFATSPGAYTSSSYLLVGGQNGRIFRVDDPQNVTDLTGAVDITPSGASTTNGSVVSAFGIHPTNPDIVIAGYANYGINSIYVTSDATSATPTWTLVERNLSAHSIRSAAIAEVGGEVIYFVGTARGLYTSNDPENNDWDLEGEDVLGFALVSGLVYRASDNTLLIGTHGNGMYQATVENTLSINDPDFPVSDISVYPNPTTEILNFKLNVTVNLQDLAYEVFNVSGQKVMDGTMTNNSINVSQLNNGLYFVKLITDNGDKTIKFIKE